jgi:hypothetical protein
LSFSRNNRRFELVFLIRLLNKSKVLNPCEISINITNMVPVLFYLSYSKFLGCDRLPPLNEILSRDLARLERRMGLGY